MQTSLRTALHVVTHPEAFCSTPAELAIHWERLKNARSQTVDHDRIGAPAYLVVNTDRIRTKVREYAQTKGYDLPPDAA
tara:strand:+ start:141 stop:377 length:237 start_codon:yes stop_codon:yes gene_type:complete